MREGADAYLSKASDKEEILLWIERAIERRQTRQSIWESQLLGACEVRLFLDTTATLFAEWLAEHTKMAPYREFPAEKGRLVLQNIKPQLSVAAPMTLAMDAFYVVPKEHENAETALPIPAAITFRVIPLSSESVEVQAECHQPAVANYFRELLAEIRQRWPMAGQGSAAASSQSATAAELRLPAHLAQREADLEDSIAQAQRLLKEYDDVLLVEDNPKRRMKYQREVKQLKATVANYRQQYETLLHELAQITPTPVLQDIGTQLEEMDDKLDVLLEGQTALAMGLMRVRADILGGIDASARSAVQVIVGALQQKQLETVRTVLDGIDRGRATDDEVLATLDAIRQALQEMQQKGVAPPVPGVAESAEQLAEVVGAPGLDVKHKLKAVIPIIPILLQYEGEISLGSGMNLEAAWNKLVDKLKRSKNSA